LDKTRYDVIVVGAGPAGSTAAKYAAANGAEVLLIDKKKDIGSPIQCGGLLPHSSELREMLPDADKLDELIPRRGEFIHTTTECMEIVPPHGKAKMIEVGADIIDRKSFDKFLAREAARAGADLLVWTRVTDLHGATVSVSGFDGEKEIAAKAVIGADGPTSIIARKSGLVSKMDLGPAFEYEVVNADIDDDVVEIHFGNRIAPGGYAWVIPLGGDKAHIGVGIRQGFSSEKVTIKAYLDRFMAEHTDKFRDAEVTSIISGSVPTGGAPPKTCTDCVLLAGDAAGHVMATNGGGVPLAMLAGKIGGETAAEHISGKCPLEDYEHRWRSLFGVQLDSSVTLRKYFDTIMKSDVAFSAAIKLLSERRLKDIMMGHRAMGVQDGHKASGHSIRVPMSCTPAKR